MDSTDDDDGAWAGDDIPVPEPPTMPAWTTRQPSDPTFDALDSTPEPTFDPLTGRISEPVPPPTFWNERNKLIAGAVAALVVVAAVFVALTGGDDPTPDAAPATTEEPTATTEPTTESSVETTEGRVTVPMPSVEFQQIELPPAVAAISKPTEVLIVGSDERLYTLSLPSGTVRSVSTASDDVGVGGGVGGSPAVAVAPDAAAITTGDGVVIVPREGPTLVVGASKFGSPMQLDVLGWSLGADGSTGFTVQNYGSSGESNVYRVSLDGSVTPVGDSRLTGGFFGRQPSGDGRTYVTDAGGLYVVDPAGSAQRIDDGFLLAVNASTRMVRECSEQLVCEEVLVDQETGERRVIPPDVLTDEFSNGTYGLDLAPDGSALSAIRGTETGQDRVLLDLITGVELTSTDDGFSWGTSTRWAADSSGVFDVGGTEAGLKFVDRSSGDTIRFGEEFGQVISVATRMPDAELGVEAAVFTTPITFADGDDPSPTGLEVIGLGRSGNVMAIDIDARTVDFWQSTTTGSVREPSLFVFGDRVAVVSDDENNDAPPPRGYVAHPGGRELLPDGLLGSGPPIAGPTAGTVWTSTGPRDAVELRLVDLGAGAPVDPAQVISVPDATLIGGDGSGGLVIERGGDVYVATVESVDRLTSGQLLAIGPDTAYVRECDDASICEVLRIDRLTGRRTMVDPTSPLAAAAAVEAADGILGITGSSVAPGGDTAVVRLSRITATGETPEASTTDLVWAVVDVVDLVATPVTGMNGTDPIVWSSDGRAAATVAGPDLVVYVQGEGMRRVAGPGSIRTIAATPRVAG